MTSSNASAAAPRRQLEPTHSCIRCGRAGVPADAGLCELCNPLELSQPSATQMHGIAAVGIIGFIVVLAVAGRAVLSGTGPFTGQVSGVAAAAAGLEITIAVTNGGSKAAATTCTIREASLRTGGPIQVVQTPLVPAASTISFTAVVDRFGKAPVDLAAECQSP